MPVAVTQPVYPPSAGQPIEEVWGDAVSDSVVQRFSSTTDRDTKWPDPPNGALAWIGNELQVRTAFGWASIGSPVGSIIMFGGTTEPALWMFCRGQEISRGNYPALFAAIGTSFGAGNGTTTFRIPDYRGRYPIGFNQGGSYFSVGVGEQFGNKDAQLVAHGHVVDNHVHNGVDHLHHVNINTGFDPNVGSGNGHYHRGPQGLQYVVAPGGIGLAGGGAFGVGTADTTQWNETSHNHNVSGYTAPADRGLTTGGATPNTNVVGGSGVNANLPPSTSLNFIIKYAGS